MRLGCYRILAGLAAALLFITGAAAEPPSTPVGGIRALAAQPALLPQSSPWDGRDWIERFYAARSYAPAWTPGQAERALALLEDAASEGLAPSDYGVGELRAQLRDGAAHTESVDLALTAAMLHYLADLHLGRVRSEYHSAPPAPGVAQFDPVEYLRGALDQDRLEQAAVEAEPGFPLYRRVRDVLARYRSPKPLDAGEGTVKAGDRYESAVQLHARLWLLGDLPAGVRVPRRAVYTAALAQGVRRFQARHGLPADGVLGGDTIASLNAEQAQRVRQLELTLERLRWLPDLPPGPMVAVNLPGYRLWAFDTSDPDARPLEMRVIVGEAIKNPTPLFVGQMRYLEFNPYWNVPRSITVNEIIPKLERDRAYLAQNNMELVGAGAATSRVNAAALDALRAGTLRVRQRPGPKNSLGAVKFAMPNPMDIYLHATPARELFRRTRRDLSHGCIRVERPAELAQFVLHDQPAWELDEIHAAMTPGPTLRVSLSAPVPVVIFYATAVVDRDGRAVFARDVYGRDPQLEQALAEHGAAAVRQIVPASQASTE